MSLRWHSLARGDAVSGGDSSAGMTAGCAPFRMILAFSILPCNIEHAMVSLPVHNLCFWAGKVSGGDVSPQRMPSRNVHARRFERGISTFMCRVIMCRKGKVYGKNEKKASLLPLPSP